MNPQPEAVIARPVCWIKKSRGPDETLRTAARYRRRKAVRYIEYIRTPVSVEYLFGGTRMSDLDDFRSSIVRHLVPVAFASGLGSAIWIPREDYEMLYLFRGNPFDLLVYNAAGHGVNMTVTIAPEGEQGWNPRELGPD